MCHNSSTKIIITHGIKFGTSQSITELVINNSEHVSDSNGGILVISSNHGNTNTGLVCFFNGINTLGTRRIHNSTKANNSEPFFIRSGVHEFLSKLFIGSDRALVDGSTAKSKDTETVRTQNGNLFLPVFLVTRFEVRDVTTLSLVGTKSNHAVRGTFDVNNVLIIESIAINRCNGFVDSSHELVFGAERHFVYNRGVGLEGIDVDSTKVGGAEDGNFSRVTNFSFASTSFTKRTFTTQNTSSKSRLDEVG
mmetsp:Transcript_28255/g.39769  ORF Transcript_28255/g.39769 Transcript_28255/m.39769 type:complete len:251 (-) Transcript_28255:1567-2319(-)